MTTHHHLNPAGNSCEDILPLIPAYAFGATDPHETALVESMLAHCPDAAAELETYREIYAEMHYDVPLVKAPRSVRDGLQSRLADQIKQEAPTDPTPHIHPVAMPPTQQPTQPNAEPRRNLFWVYATAAALMLLVLSNVLWAVRVDELQQQENNLRALLADEPANLAFLNTAEISISRLAATDTQTPYTASLLWSADSQSAVLYADDLPQIAAGQSFQLWLLQDDMRHNGGVFNATVDGSGVLTIDAPLPIDAYTQFGITVEPAGGSEAPTTQPILVGAL